MYPHYLELISCFHHALVVLVHSPGTLSTPPYIEVKTGREEERPRQDNLHVNILRTPPFSRQGSTPFTVGWGVEVRGLN